MEEFDLTKYIDNCMEIPTSGYFLPEQDTIRHNLTKDNYTVALIGVPEESDTHNKGCEQAPNAIRKQLYELSYPFKKISITDLGNLKHGNKRNDHYYALTDVIEELTKKNIIPIILGGSHDLTISMVKGIKWKKDNQRITIIDSKIDLSTKENPLTAHNFLKELLKEPHNINLLGLQNYYCSDWQEKMLHEKDVLCERIRSLHNNIRMYEPTLRDTDLLSFDISAIRQSDAPAKAIPTPNGLSALEACELANYAGISDSINVLGLFGMNPMYDNSDQTAALAAQIIWYFLLGIDNRFGDYPLKPISEYQRYMVYSTIEGEQDTCFYYNTWNGRWWIEIPTQTGNKIFACNKEDYDAFRNNSIPNIWMRHYMK